MIREIPMKKISMSLESIKASHGAVKVQTGCFDKVLPYYVRQLEDVAAEHFLKRLNNNDVETIVPPAEGGNDE